MRNAHEFASQVSCKRGIANLVVYHRHPVKPISQREHGTHEVASLSIQPSGAHHVCAGVGGEREPLPREL